MGTSRRLLIYGALAVPLLAGAFVLRLSTHDSDHTPPLPPQHPHPIPHLEAADVENTAYLGKINAICDRATRTGATLPDPKPTLASYELALRVSNAQAVPILREVRAIRPPPWFKPWHERLIAMNERVLTAYQAAERQAAKRNLSGLRAALTRANSLNRPADQLASAMGLLYCLTAPETSPHLAYPPAPKRHGRTLLSWPAFDRALDGICADNANRLTYGEELAQKYRPFSKGERNTGVWRLRDAAFQRKYDLIRRLGRPPSDRPVFQQWLAHVRQRASVMHREFLAAFTYHAARVKQLAAKFDRLTVDEHYLGARFGLRACSASGPSQAPAQTQS